MNQYFTTSYRLWFLTFFFFSGISGLIYQVVWMRMLIRVFGITLYATSTIIAIFMGGLALGSYFFGRIAAQKNILRLYGLVEIGIGLGAFCATFLMQRLPELYASLALYWDIPQWGVSQPFEVIVRFVFSAAVLFIPTFLMGATLPLMSRWLTGHNREIGANVALLYGINTLGAVFGVLFSGFYSLGHLIWMTRSSRLK